MALTLLDGRTIHLPARRARKTPSAPSPPPSAPTEEPSSEKPVETGRPSEAPTARDVIRALRAIHEGADPRAILGQDLKWESLFAALLSALLKKGVVADWEFIEELRALEKPRGEGG
jgi:hypothetical protein